MYVDFLSFMANPAASGDEALGVSAITWAEVRALGPERCGDD
jgi:hypothetical protein